MNIAFYLAHPSQYYVLKSSIQSCGVNNNVFVFIKTKDILENLLIEDNVKYENVYPLNKRKGKFNLIKSVIKRNRVLYSRFKKNKINLLVTCASDSCQAAFLASIPSIVLNDDDIDVIKNSSIFGWPFSSIILAPKSCEMGKWKKKLIPYSGYQKLTYTHPNSFTPNPDVLKQYDLYGKDYFLIRSVSLSAHHDNNIRGLNNEIVRKIIHQLEPVGQVLISSENDLIDEFEKYAIKIKFTDIHHVIAGAKLLIGDSQSMAHEAALLGTPSVRFNDFVGKIGVLEELEHKYQLTFGIPTDQENKLYDKINEILNQSKDVYTSRMKLMLNDMIDVSNFLSWFIENYPESKNIMLKNPDYQDRFK